MPAGRQEEERIRFLVGARMANVPPMSLCTLLEKRGGNMDGLIKCNQKEFREMGLPPKPAEVLCNVIKSNTIDAVLDNCQKADIKLLDLNSPKYPQFLKEIPDQPYLLFYKGNIEALQDKPNLSVVGTRRMTIYGKTVLPGLLKPIVDAGVNIISGLAIGVDALAHKVALENGGCTAAILGSGLNFIYPAANEKLAADIITSGGALISEYIPDERPYLGYFPERNRIVAGLSRAVLVVEASHKSGAKITARLAAEYGRDVMALPGDINRDQSQGTNDLIRDGAASITAAADIAEVLGIKIDKQQKDVNLQGNTMQLYTILTKGPASVDILATLAKLTITEVLCALSDLELLGLTKRDEEGRYYATSDS